MFVTTTDYSFTADFATRSAELAQAAAEDRLAREVKASARRVPRRPAPRLALRHQAVGR